jgi:hypothetical protein
MTRFVRGRGHRRALVFLFATVSFAIINRVSAESEPNTIDSATIPKFAHNIGPVPVYATTSSLCGTKKCRFAEVSMSSFSQQVLPPGFPETPVFGYGGQAVNGATGAPMGYVRGWPGPSFIAKPGTAADDDSPDSQFCLTHHCFEGEPTKVKWTNKITSPHLFTVDKTLVDTTFDSQSSVPVIPHIHGAEVQSKSDGYPQVGDLDNGSNGI